MKTVSDIPAHSTLKNVVYKFAFADEYAATLFLFRANNEAHVKYAQHPKNYHSNDSLDKNVVLVTSSTGSLIFELNLLDNLKKVAEELGGAYINC